MGRAILGAIALLVSGSAAFACGTERWPVKTGTDRDAGSVDQSLQTPRWRKADSNRWSHRRSHRSEQGPHARGREPPRSS
jgi:hypothetical protein